MSEPGKPERFDAGDAESVGRKKADTNARVSRKRKALADLLATPAGREWAWDLLSDCYIFHTTFTGNAQGYFNEGKRNVGLQFLAEITAIDPQIFATMMKENTKNA